MKIYLDTCCLNRPFDDQRQARIRLESEAIILILEKIHQDEWEWVGSEAVLYEIEQTIEVTDEILEDAERLVNLGFDDLDAIHLASAKVGKVDAFLTTDDNLQKIANKNNNEFSFSVINPVKWLEEVLK
jgi:predicted nucleic acid-binding protein